MRVLITESWLFGSSLLLALGLASGSVVLVALGVLVLGTGGAARLWSRLSLEEVVYARTLSERRVFVGETVEVTLTLDNRKVLPVPWLELREAFPRGMQALDTRLQVGGPPGTMLVVRQTALGGRDHVEWPIMLRAVRRGYFRIGPGRLRSGDIFGFFERDEIAGGRPDGIIVYPRTYTLPELGLEQARPFGEQRGGERIFEDPSRVVGVRDYQPGDPMRRIDWKATARLQRLQSRLYEPSRTQSVVIALNIPTFERIWQGSDPVLLERGISVASSLARAAFEEGAAIGIVANGSFPDADRPIRIGASNSPEQLNRVLEALAMITSFTTSDLAAELEDHAHALPVGATIVVVAAVMPEELAATLHRLRGEGHHVHVVRTSHREWAAPLGAIPVSDVVPYMEQLEEDLARQGLGVQSEETADEALGIRAPV